MPRPAVIRLSSPGFTRACVPTLSRCSIVPPNSQLTVCSPVCGCGATIIPPVSSTPAGPGPGVRRVLGRDAGLAEVEGLEGVDHDRGLLEPLRSQRRLDRTRLRTVRVAAGVHRDRAEADPRALARLVVAA